MFLSEPSRTNYDINFTLFGFDVRVHPAFFIMPLLLGASWLQAENAGMNLIILITVFFVSILVHELGHAFAFRYFGQPARIVLYWMGGLAIPDGGGPWAINVGTRLTPQQKIVVSAAGPGFGFLLAASLVGVVFAMGGKIEVLQDGIFPALIPRFTPNNQPNIAVITLLYLGIWANIFFNILNLAPVFPLDGGQISRELFEMNDGFNGTRNSIMLSILVGALVAVFSFSTGDRFIGFFFAFMAWSNYMTLQQMGGGFGGNRPW